MDQNCYFNIDNNDKPFNNFLEKQIKNSDLKETDIHFQIVSNSVKKISKTKFFSCAMKSIKKKNIDSTSKCCRKNAFQTNFINLVARLVTFFL